MESGDVRVYIFKEKMYSIKDSKIIYNNTKNHQTAELLLKPEANKAYYHSLISSESWDDATNLRYDIISTAYQYLGNPYVWGGTSLTEGCDCSGYCLSIFKKFGIKLPRTSSDQSTVGEKESIENAKPGDLVFFFKAEGIGHVGIYLGNNMMINASTEDTGIIVSKVGDNVAWACNVLSDSY